MSDHVTVTGLVATAPRQVRTATGLPIATFRLASSQRRFDRTQQKWVDGETNWYTITSFRQLAQNVMSSIEKGQRVVVTGRLRIRDWVSGEKAGTSVEVDADAVGHDLAWGTATYTRSMSGALAAGSAEGAEPPEPADGGAPEPGDAFEPQGSVPDGAESPEPEPDEAAATERASAALPF